MRKILLGLGLFVALFLSACTSNEKDTLRVATNANFPPYEYIENGDYAGIDIEIAKQIAKELNLKLDIQNMPFDSIIAAVASNKADIGISGFTVTDERKKSINFSDSYAKSKQAIIVKDDSSIKKVDDLYGDNAYRVGVQLSTTGAIYFGDDIEKKKTKATLHEYHNGADAVAALIAGKIDCVIIDEQPAKSFVASNRGLEILATEYVEEEYAIIVSKEKEELLKKINSIISKLKSDGTIDAIQKKYIK